MNKLIFKILGLIFAVLFLGVVSFYLGSFFLKGLLIGSDTPHALSHIDYLYRYWPQKVLWQPIYGRGMSLLGFNRGGFWVTAITARVLGWLPVQALRFWQLNNMFLASLAIFALGWSLAGYLAGFLAGFFFLISQISWFWQTRIGLFEFQGAFVWLPLFFVFFHKALTRKSHDFYQLILVLISALILGLAIWWHLVVGVLIIEASLIYCLFLFAKKRLSLPKRFWQWIKIVSFGILLVSFFLIPQFYYNRRIVGGRVSYFTQANLPQISWLKIWGLKGAEWLTQNDIWQGYFALPVVIFAGIGLILALFKKNLPILLLFGLCLLSSFQTAGEEFLGPLVKIFLPVFALVNVRAILMAIVFLPIVAGFGISKLAELVFLRIKKQKLRLILIVVFSLILTLIGIKTFDRAPANYKTPCLSSFGSDNLSLGPDKKEFCPSLAGMKQDLPLLFKPSKEAFEAQASAYLSSLIPYTPNTGADITYRRGRHIEEWSLVSQVPILQSYDYPVILKFKSFVNEALYLGKGKKEEVAQIVSWFGLDYLVLDPANEEEVKIFDQWQKVGPEDVWVIKSPQPTGLGTLSLRPAIIFFGDKRQEAYFKWWQFLVNGGLDYSTAFIADGGERIEDYSLEELLPFKAIFFWGETFKNEKKAFDLIEQYLKKGGKVLIDSGWQYTSSFWQEENLPDWLPTKSTEWHVFDQWQLEAKGVDFGFDVSQWQAPKWEGKAWGASAAKIKDLKNSASAGLVDKNSNSVLVARMNVGQGEIIWTGLNFVGMYQADDLAGVIVFNNLLESLVKSEPIDYSFQVERTEPEKVRFTLDSQNQATWFYWREASFPSWKAKSNTGEIKIYRGGPGLMLLSLPPKTTELTLFHSHFWATTLGMGISVTSCILILIALIFKYRSLKQTRRE